MTQNYEILFSIELLHEYFLNGKCTDLAITPSEDTMSLFKGMNIQARQVENRLVAFVKVNDLKQPFINIPPALLYRELYGKKRFRFYIRLKNPLFLNYTNIELSGLRSKALYFSNLAGNSKSATRYLSLPVKHYAVGEDYLPGDLASDPANDLVYEAIKKHSAKKKTGLSDRQFWTPKSSQKQSRTIKDLIIGKHYDQGDLVTKSGTSQVFEAVKSHTSKLESELENPSLWKIFEQRHKQYVTPQDLVEHTGSSYLFITGEPLTKATITVSGFNYNLKKPAYDLAVTAVEKRVYEKPAREVKIDLSSLSPGKYEITVNKESKIIYYDPVLKTGDILGVVEIFNHLDAGDEYALLSDKEEVIGSNFMVQFPNRKVLWKYTRKDAKADIITDTGETGYSFSLQGDHFISETPIPLSESVVKTLKLEFNTKDFRLFPLPNPTINHLAIHKQDDYDYLCSEIFLNY